MQENVPLNQSKPAVSHLVNNLNQLNNDQCLEISNHAISLFTGGLQLIFEQEVSNQLPNQSFTPISLPFHTTYFHSFQLTSTSLDLRPSRPSLFMHYFSDYFSIHYHLNFHSHIAINILNSKDMIQVLNELFLLFYSYQSFNLSF